jgi:ribonuclease HII
MKGRTYMDADDELIDLGSDIKMKRQRKIQVPLHTHFDSNLNVIEIGVDEVGRGPLFGRVYAGVVVLPEGSSSGFRHDWMKDSKKFHSKKKIEEIAEHIREHAIAWSVEYEDEFVIDEINILQATQRAMHKGIYKVLEQLSDKKENKEILLLVDGNYFKPYSKEIKHVTIEGGDNKFTCIAAASILAKVARDKYIEELCAENPELAEKYSIDSNKGYGSKKHLEGIRTHGITKWHRKTFGICRQYLEGMETEKVS